MEFRNMERVQFNESITPKLFTTAMHIVLLNDSTNRETSPRDHYHATKFYFHCDQRAVKQVRQKKITNTPRMYKFEIFAARISNGGTLAPDNMADR